MKRLFLLLFVFLVCSLGTTYGQWYINNFDTAVQDSAFTLIGTGIAPGYAPDPRAYQLRSDDPAVKVEGAASMKVQWHVFTNQGWGGFNQLQHLIPQAPKKFWDWGGASHVSIWFNNTVKSTKGPALVQFRFKLHEAGGSADYWNNRNDIEDWYYQTPAVFDTTPGWHQLLLPLKDNGTGAPDSTGFTFPGWSGTANNSKLDLDKVAGYSLEWTAPLLSPDSIASGEVYYDKLQLVGNRYPPITTFDNVASTPDFFKIDSMSWDAGNKGYIHLNDVTVNPFEGTSSLQVDYKVNATQGWGGYANFEHIESTPLDLSQRSYLLLYVKNLVPNALKDTTGTKPRLTCRFILYDDSQGAGHESWFTLVNINVDSTSDWQQVRIPLVDLGIGWDLTPNGFKNPDGQGGQDRIFSTTKIGGWKIEYSVDVAGPTGAAIVSQGSMLFDLLQTAGFQQADKTAPLPPTSIAAVGGSYVNLVTWNDVAGEGTRAKYDVYFSQNPITDINAAGVEVVELGVPGGVGVSNHALRAPVTNQPVTYYYAVTCTDTANNVGLPGVGASPVTNTAKGVPTVSLSPPTSFNADGDLSEWANIKPITFSKDSGTGYVAPNTVITNDADCSAKAYLAVDNTYLYVAFDITDDLVFPDLRPESYLNDAPDLYIGLYDWHGAPHGAYKRGTQPDYHFRFNKGKAREDATGTDSILAPGANYFWGEKLLSPGYVVEARLSWAQLGNKIKADSAYLSTFAPKNGMRVPIDFSVNDNDGPAPTGTRAGILCYSPNNNDLSYQTTSRWTVTWIGNQWVVGVNDQNPTLPNVYALEQNYPNPFNPSTQIRYSLAKSGPVSVKVYDVLGREVAQLVNEEQQAGKHVVSFNTGTARSGLSSGVYFYRIESGSFRDIKKMMLIK